jgi:hypothetical protein
VTIPRSMYPGIKDKPKRKRLSPVVAERACTRAQLAAELNGETRPIEARGASPAEVAEHSAFSAPPRDDLSPPRMPKYEPRMYWRESDDP